MSRLGNGRKPKKGNDLNNSIKRGFFNNFPNNTDQDKPGRRQITSCTNELYGAMEVNLSAPSNFE
jgi:hypothetical protein